MNKYKFLTSILLIPLLAFSFSFFVYAEEDNDNEEEQTVSSNEDTEDDDNSSDSNEEEDSDEDADEPKSYREKMEERWGTKELKLEQRKEELKQRLEEKRDDVIERRCEEVVSRVTKRITQYNKNVGVHIDNYTRLYERLDEITKKLAAKGYDVAKLEADMVVLDNMVNDYAGIYAGFIAQLTESQSLACGESEGAFKQLLQDARMQLKAAIESRQEIRYYYEHTIRQDIKDIREQKVDDSSEAGEVDDE